MPSLRHSVQRYIGIVVTLLYALFTQTLLNLSLYCLKFETSPSLYLIK